MAHSASRYMQYCFMFSAVFLNDDDNHADG